MITENLKINLFKNNLYNLFTDSGLPLSVINLILENALYDLQAKEKEIVSNEYNEYINNLNNNNDNNNSAEGELDGRDNEQTDESQN